MHDKSHDDDDDDDDDDKMNNISARFWSPLIDVCIESYIFAHLSPNFFYRGEARKCEISNWSQFSTAVGKVLKLKL